MEVRAGARGTPGNAGCLVCGVLGIGEPWSQYPGQMLDSSERSPQTSSSSSGQPEQERGTWQVWLAGHPGSTGKL